MKDKGTGESGEMTFKESMAGEPLRDKNRSGSVKREDAYRMSEKFKDYGTNWLDYLNRMQEGFIIKKFLNIFYNAEKNIGKPRMRRRSQTFILETEYPDGLLGLS
jgi:hypothetical protein